MEKEQNHTAGIQEQEQNPGTEKPEITTENIGQLIAEELEKVVGLDETVLAQYAAFLENMKAQETETLLATLKKDLDEKLLPFLELMVQQGSSKIAEAGIGVMGKIQSFKAAQFLAEINESHPDKTLRKAARKSLYKLKSAGIEVEMTHKPLLGEIKHQRYKSLISPIDGTGTQLIMLTQEMLAGDLHLLQVVASDEQGIVECSSRRGLTKKMFAKLPETFARQTGAKSAMFVEADYDYAMTLISEAEAITEVIPEEYTDNKELFELEQAQSVENPVFKMLDVENLKDQPYFLRTSADLFQNDVFLSWHLPVNETAEYAQELLDQQDSVLELSPQFQQQRKEDVYLKVIESSITEEFLKRLQRRLQIMAYIFMTNENEENAKKALAAAVTLPETPSERLKDHAFLRQLLLISLEATQYVLEEGYDPGELKREDYIVTRGEEGKIIVEFVQE
ncbi:hypothetical protein U27_01346 [Candidatus Vecturithrix granuli]|uniref:Uncharacterized protein n=1 Tax=Vecturithrix granuli TaxID=1499967 RepID=A0A081CA41_VECG1|nr:hypothetical protein U27_01346 [Candidatus Vecturithrix granuli]